MKPVSVCALVAVAGLAAVSGAQSPAELATMKRLEREAVDYFWTQSNPYTGVTRDRAPNAPGATTPNNGPGGWYDQCNISATGYALASYAIGAHEGFLNRQEALQRTRNTLAHFDTTDPTIQANGWFIQWLSYDKGNALALYSGWPEDVSTIDNGHFFAGVLLAESYFDDATVRQHAENIMKRIDWRWMLSQGGEAPHSAYYPGTYDPGSGEFSGTYQYMNEGADLVLTGIGDDPGQVPIATWSSWYKPVLSVYGYQTFLADSLYLHEMSEGYFDYFGQRDAQGYDYWVASRNALLMNREYCSSLRGADPYFTDNIWGLSVCDAPAGNGSTTYVGYPYGGPWLPDANGNDPGSVAYNNSGNGTIDPSATMAGIGYALDGSSTGGRTVDYGLRAMDAFVEEYPQMEGEYGFYAGINPTWHTSDALGIDLGPLVLAIQNKIDNMPHDAMSANPIVRSAMKAVGFHKTREGAAWDRPLRKVDGALLP